MKAEEFTTINMKAAIDRAEQIGFERGIETAAHAVEAVEWWHGGGPLTPGATSCTEDMAKRIRALVPKEAR
jgi:hypothetical protein